MAMFARASRKVLKTIGAIKEIKSSPEDEALLEKIRKNVQLDSDATSHQRELELDDLRFLDPTTHWDDADRRSREAAGRPCLTEDRLGPFHRQVCNEQRKNKPGCQVDPVDSGSDVDTAEIIQGLIRHIEYSSNADTAYDTAFWWAAGTGRGFYRLCTDYVDSESFDQEIQIKRVPNPHMVFIDPAAVEADFSDMKWGGFKVWMSQNDFKAEYPNAQLANAGTSVWKSIGDDAEDWMSKDGGACLVVEYFYKEFKKVTVKEGKREREAIQTTIKWVKCTAVEVLERGELPGEYIPIVAVLGEEKIVDGHRTWAGIVRAGKDPQKRINYLVSSQMERIAFMPIATFIGAKGFMGKNRQVWDNAHKLPMAALEFEIIGDDGQGINRPELITSEAPIMAVNAAMVGGEQGLKAVLGMYDPNMGKNESNQSGVAITRLQNQGDTSNYHLQDNLGRAIRYEGRIILSWLPTYYDTERVIRIVNEDGTQNQVKINAPIEYESEAVSPEQVGKIFDLKTGKYDVTISVGPSYQSKRAEDRAMLLGMLQGPMGELVAQRAGDLVAKTLDSPIAWELSERLIPPDIAAKEQQGQNAIPPEAQQQMQQMSQQLQMLGQQHEMLTQALHQAQDKLDNKQLELESRERIALQTNRANVIIAQAKIEGAAALEALKAEFATIDRRLALLDNAVPIPGDDDSPQGTPAGPSAGAEAPEQPVSAVPAGEGVMQ